MDPVTIMTAKVTELETTLGGVAPEALGVGVAIFGLIFAWRLVKKFAN